MQRLIQVIGLVAVLMVASMPGWSQSYTATVRGVVTDGSGAAVPGARVMVVEADRNVAHKTTADAMGRYVLTALQPGNYTLSAEAAGFKKWTRNAFPLAVQEQATVDVALEVGDVNTSIEVEASAPLLNTTMANLGQVVDNKYMVALPNIARDPLYLTYMTPGVVGAAGKRGDTNTNFIANGTRNMTADVLVDGVSVTTSQPGQTDLKYKPSVDVVQEFKMQTNFFAAEYGQSGGSVINMITKSGSNQFHGTAYYFLRHSDLNANQWFSNRAGKSRPFYRRDQAGGVLGGPIKKNKTFFLATYQYTRQQSPLSYTGTFPTTDQLNGDFSKTFTAAGQRMAVYNPYDTFTNAAGLTQRRPFANNIIPTSMFDPVALKALPYFPKANQTTNAVTNTNNWFGQGINKSPGYQMDYKADHNFTDRDRLTGRFSYAKGDGTPDNLFGAGNPAYTFNDGPSTSKTISAVADYTRIQSANTILTFRYGFVGNNYVKSPFTTFDSSTLGFPQYMLDNSTYRVFPMFSPEGYTAIGTQGWLIMDRQEAVHQTSGSMTRIQGAHSIKVGYEARWYALDYQQPGYPSGQFGFGAQTTRQDLNLTSGSQGNGFASMLLGFGNGSNFHIDPKTFSRYSHWGGYVQDDWKVTSKLTLNLGLRYEFDIPRHETQNRYSYWDLGAASPITVPGYDLRGVFKFVNDDNRSPLNGDYNNFGPRFGFAYAATPKLAIRGGGGIFYAPSLGTVTGHTGTAFNTNSTVTWSKDNNATQYAHLSNPWPDGMTTPPGSSQGDATFIGMTGASTMVRQFNLNPQYYQWNLSIQRELVWNSILEVNYTGSRGLHLQTPATSLSNLDPSYWGIGRTALNAQVANPFYGIITDPRATNMNGKTIQRYRLLRGMPQYDGAGGSEPNNGDSIYHALQVKLEKRFSHGFNMLAHYTWSKMIDDASISSSNTSYLGGTTSMQNPLDFSLERSLSAHDIPHRLVVSSSYQLPFGHGRKFASSINRVVDAFVGGWEISGMLLMQSGSPLQVAQSGGQLWNGTQRPNLISDPSTSGSVQSRLNGYFNPAAFSQPAMDTFGTAPRYLGYRGPGIRTLDAALSKSWRVKEGQRAEFRLEAQNALNHPIFGDPDGNYGSTTFGVISGTKVDPRNVQLGFKYYF